MKKLEVPALNEKFFYGSIRSWVIHEPFVRDKGYAVRIRLTFDSGKECMVERTGFRTKERAKKRKNSLEVELATGKFCPFSFTMEQFFQFYLYEVCLNRKKVAYSTFVDYKGIINNYLLPALKPNKRINTITRKQLYQLLVNIPSPGRRKTAAAFLRTSLTYADLHNIIPVNPMNSVWKRLIREEKLPSNAAKLPRMTLTEEQIKRLMLRCREDEDFSDIYPLLLICLVCGVRISECIAVRVEDIVTDSQGGLTLHVSQQWGRKLVDGYVVSGLKNTKENNHQDIPIRGFAADEIMVWIHKKKKGFLFERENGKLFDRSYVTRRFKQLLVACDLPTEVHLHDLRHCFATILSCYGTSDKAISVLLGHRSGEQFTRRTYIDDGMLIYDVSEELQEIACHYFKMDQGDAGLPDLYTDEDLAKYSL